MADNTPAAAAAAATVPTTATATPRNAAERLDCIGQHEQYLLSLPQKENHPKDCLKVGASFLAVLAFCVKDGDGPDTSASDESASSAAPSAGTGAAASATGERRKRGASERNATKPPAKKPRRGGNGGSGSGGGGHAVIPSKTLVACMTDVNTEWVLGRIKCYVSDTKKYEVLDEADSNVYTLPRKCIRLLSKKSTNTLEAKQRVLAVYPSTTVFYPAALVRKSGKNWLVEFDDEDANTTQVKEVSAMHVMAE